MLWHGIDLTSPGCRGSAMMIATVAFQEDIMADTRGPEPRRPVTSDSGFMPVWGWVTLAIAVVVVFGLIFLWNGDATQQTAQSPASPPATGCRS